MRGSGCLVAGSRHCTMGNATPQMMPMLLVLAEKEELMDNKQNGAKVYEIIQAKKSVPVALHTIKDITHYGIYKEGFEEATKLELAWFGKHLAPLKPEK